MRSSGLLGWLLCVWSRLVASGRRDSPVIGSTKRAKCPHHPHLPTLPPLLPTTTTTTTLPLNKQKNIRDKPFSRTGLCCARERDSSSSCAGGMMECMVFVVYVICWRMLCVCFRHNRRVYRSESSRHGGGSGDSVAVLLLLLLLLWLLQLCCVFGCVMVAVLCAIVHA